MATLVPGRQRQRCKSAHRCQAASHSRCAAVRRPGGPPTERRSHACCAAWLGTPPSSVPCSRISATARPRSPASARNQAASWNSAATCDIMLLTAWSATRSGWPLNSICRRTPARHKLGRWSGDSGAGPPSASRAARAAAFSRTASASTRCGSRRSDGGGTASAPDRTRSSIGTRSASVSTATVPGYAVKTLERANAGLVNGRR